MPELNQSNTRYLLDHVDDKLITYIGKLALTPTSILSLDFSPLAHRKLSLLFANKTLSQLLFTNLVASKDIIQDESIDLVLANFVLNVAFDAKEGLLRVHRALHKQGYFLFSVNDLDKSKIKEILEELKLFYFSMESVKLALPGMKETWDFSIFCSTKGKIPKVQFELSQDNRIRREQLEEMELSAEQPETESEKPELEDEEELEEELEEAEEKEAPETIEKEFEPEDKEKAENSELEEPEEVAEKAELSEAAELEQDHDHEVEKEVEQPESEVEQAEISEKEEETPEVEEQEEKPEEEPEEELEEEHEEEPEEENEDEPEEAELEEPVEAEAPELEEPHEIHQALHEHSEKLEEHAHLLEHHHESSLHIFEELVESQGGEDHLKAKQAQVEKFKVEHQALLSQYKALVDQHEKLIKKASVNLQSTPEQQKVLAEHQALLDKHKEAIEVREELLHKLYR